MATDVVMPQLGMTMTEGTVVRWYKKVGDEIKLGDTLFEVETDKVTQDVEAYDAGVLSRIVVGDGQTVPVGTVIAYLNEDQGTGNGGQGAALTPSHAGRAGGSSPAAGDALTPTLSQGERVVSGVSQGERETAGGGGAILRSSPAARNLARKLGVDIATLKGSGPAGRIIEADVRKAAAAAAQPAVIAFPPIPAAPQAPVPPSPRPPVPPSPGERVELKGIKKVVADRMAQSFSTAPHFYLTVEVNAGELVALRKQIGGAVQRRHGVDVTITDLLVKAVAIALKEHPEANAAWSGSGYQLNGSVNMGLAVAMGDGLVVPVIQGADALSLGQIARKRTELVERARNGQLTLPELEGGSFTLSNLGMFGIDLFQAIVNPPQAAILAVGRIKDRVVPVDGVPAVRPTMFVTLSSDHRILDGAAAARFLARVVQLLEDPVELLLADSER